MSRVGMFDNPRGRRHVRATVRLQPGDVVVRRHRLLKTFGTVLRFDGEDENGASCVWVKWNHPTTLPNPSLQSVDDLEVVEGRGSGSSAS